MIKTCSQTKKEFTISPLDSISTKPFNLTMVKNTIIFENFNDLKYLHSILNKFLKSNSEESFNKMLAQNKSKFGLDLVEAENTYEQIINHMLTGKDINSKNSASKFPCKKANKFDGQKKLNGLCNVKSNYKLAHKKFGKENLKRDFDNFLTDNFIDNTSINDELNDQEDDRISSSEVSDLDAENDSEQSELDFDSDDLVINKNYFFDYLYLSTKSEITDQHMTFQEQEIYDNNDNYSHQNNILKERKLADNNIPKSIPMPSDSLQSFANEKISNENSAQVPIEIEYKILRCSNKRDKISMINTYY